MAGIYRRTLMIYIQEIAATKSNSARPSRWMKSLITICLLIALAGASVVSACPEMGMQMTGSCCSKPTCADHPCVPELCVAKAPNVATGGETGPDLSLSLPPFVTVEAATKISPSFPVSDATPCSVPSVDPQALLQIFRI